MAIFPSEEWLIDLVDKLNSDNAYAEIAKNWEGDMAMVIEAGGSLAETKMYYLDLWHGKCRSGREVNSDSEINPAFLLEGPYENYKKLLTGELDPVQALLTRKFSVKGKMAVLMTNVPTVIDFVRCCREITDDYI